MPAYTNERLGLLIGKGGETIRGLQDEFESQIDVNDEGQVNVYSSSGELGEALADVLVDCVEGGASVSFMLRPLRSNSSFPRRSSKRRICIDTADCVLKTSSAARVKLPVSTTAMKVLSWSRSRGVAMNSTHH